MGEPVEWLGPGEMTRSTNERAKRSLVAGLRAAFDHEAPHKVHVDAFADLPPVMYRHWIARGARLPADYWWRLLGAAADWIFVARATRVLNVKGTGGETDQTPSSFSRTAGLRGNASTFTLFRRASPPAAPSSLPRSCEWHHRNFY